MIYSVYSHSVPNRNLFVLVLSLGQFFCFCLSWVPSQSGKIIYVDFFPLGISLVLPLLLPGVQ